MAFNKLLFLLPYFIFILVNNVQSLEYENVNNGLEGRIQNFPYHVNIQIELDDDRCGGVLLDSLHAATAAHCVTDKKGVVLDTSITVEAGTDFLKNKPKYKSCVKGIYLPSEYNRIDDKVYGDIAVLRLQKKITFMEDNNEGYLQLPKETKYYEGERAVITGLGYNIANPVPIKDGQYEIKGSTDDRLRYGETIILKKDDCLQSGGNQIDFNDQLCAKMVQISPYIIQGTCDGDSGGPLVLENKTTKKKVLVGILSSSTVLCYEKNKAARYTRVSRYVTFILTAMADKITSPLLKYTKLRVKNGKCSIQ